MRVGCSATGDTSVQFIIKSIPFCFHTIERLWKDTKHAKAQLSRKDMYRYVFLLIVLMSYYCGGRFNLIRKQMYNIYSKTNLTHMDRNDN